MKLPLAAPILVSALAAPAWAASPEAKFAAPQLLMEHLVALQKFYPTDDLSKNRSAGAVVTLTVAANGKVLACELLERIGEPKLADKICGFAKRIRLSPARLQDGTATLGSTTTLLRFYVPQTPQGDLVRNARMGPDAIATVAGVRQPSDVKITIQVGADGKSGPCAAFSPEQAAVAYQVCGLAAKLPFGIVRDENGMPAGYVTDRVVRLTAAQ